jgi:hypothetical protein
VFKRLSNGESIDKHILDIAFQASYQLNVVELLEIAHSTGHFKDARCMSAFDYINGKKHKDGYWKINYIYKADGYVSFDS